MKTLKTNYLFFVTILSASFACLSSPPRWSREYKNMLKNYIIQKNNGIPKPEFNSQPIRGVKIPVVRTSEMRTSEMMIQEMIKPLNNINRNPKSLIPKSLLNPRLVTRQPDITILQTFEASDYQENGQYGPSGDGSVGSTQFILGCKGRIRSFNKATGQIDNVLNMAYDRFFSSITNGAFCADPNIVFDQINRRWFLFCNASKIAADQSIVLAMSDNGNGTGDPVTPQTVWKFFVVDNGANSGFDTSLPSFDYTNLGVDQFRVYCASDILDIGNPFYSSSAAYVITTSSTQLVEILKFLHLEIW